MATNFVTIQLLDSESNRLEALINSEETRALAAETDLQNKIDTKQKKLTAGKNILLDSEGNISALGDGKVKDVKVNGVTVLNSEGVAEVDLSSYATVTYVDGESSRLETLVSNERARAEAAENILSDDIITINSMILNSEGNSRIEQIENRLPSDPTIQLASIEDVDTETARAESEELRLEGLVNSEEQRLAEEINRAKLAEATKQDKLIDGSKVVTTIGTTSFGNNTGLDDNGKIETKIKFVYDSSTGVLDIFNW